MRNHQQTSDFAKKIDRVERYGGSFFIIFSIIFSSFVSTGRLLDLKWDERIISTLLLLLLLLRISLRSLIGGLRGEMAQPRLLLLLVDCDRWQLLCSLRHRLHDHRRIRR